MRKMRVLFVCRHNSARSQMAEAFLNKLGGGRFEAESAGLEPGALNAIVVDAMREAGMDISDKKTRSVFELYRGGQLFHCVITVCDEAGAERCPVFPGPTKRLNWSFPDPSALEGTYEEKLQKTRIIRDSIKTKMEEWLKEMKGTA